MGERVQGEGDPWWEMEHGWLTRRAFLRAMGLVAGLGSAWLAGCSPTAQPKQATVAAPTASVQTVSSELVLPTGLGVNIHPSATTRADITKLAELGFRVARLDITWNRVERQVGQYDFSLYEPILDMLAAYGVRPLCILGYNNALYEQTPAPPRTSIGPHTDEVRQAFARFAAAAATHFKGHGISWEIWNEPDYTPFWYPTPLADDYMDLAKLTIPAVRRADPQSMIVAPALTGLEPQYQAAWVFIERCLILGLADLTDALSVHPYRFDAPESVSANYQRLRALLAQWSPRRKDLPIFSSEWGYSLTWVSPEQQAAYFVRLYLLNVLNGLAVSIWYDWRDDGADSKQIEENFGLLTWQGQPKPVYHAAQTLISEMAGFHLVGRVALPSSLDYALLFNMGAVYKYVVWTADTQHKVTLPINAPSVRLTSMTGEMHSQATLNGTLELDLTSNPQYFSFVPATRF